jgi:hypothetical protein
MKHWIFSCQDVSRKLSQSMDEALSLSQRMAIRIHLMMCRYCSRFHRQLVWLRKMSRLMDADQSTDKTHEKLSEETKTRIKEKLRFSL